MTEHYRILAKDFASKWLRGSTCYKPKHNQIFWQSESGRFLLMKHAGHSEYMGRFSDTARCPTRYALYDLDSTVRVDCLGRPCIKEWEGRWTKARQQELEELVEKNS